MAPQPAEPHGDRREPCRPNEESADRLHRISSVFRIPELAVTRRAPRLAVIRPNVNLEGILDECIGDKLWSVRLVEWKRGQVGWSVSFCIGEREHC
jgi:hypothetical protein